MVVVGERVQHLAQPGIGTVEYVYLGLRSATPYALVRWERDLSRLRLVLQAALIVIDDER